MHFINYRNIYMQYDFIIGHMFSNLHLTARAVTSTEGAPPGKDATNKEVDIWTIRTAWLKPLKLLNSIADKKGLPRNGSPFYFLWHSMANAITLSICSSDNPAFLMRLILSIDCWSSGSRRLAALFS